MNNFDIAKDMITAHKSYIESFMNSKADSSQRKVLEKQRKRACTRGSRGSAMHHSYTIFYWISKSMMESFI